MSKKLDEIQRKCLVNYVELRTRTMWNVSGPEITLPKIDSNHRDMGQDNWGRGDRNSRVYENKGL